MSDFLFGYYGIGLRALDAANLGLKVSGDNIANATTPGFARRRLELSGGYAVRVSGGYLDQGPSTRILRQQDLFLQASLEREQGQLATSGERLRGLQQIESVYGTLDGSSVLTAYGAFSDAFSELSVYPERADLRRVAVDSANALAQQLRDTYGRLETQQQLEDRAIRSEVQAVNRLATELATLNREIVKQEADGSVASGLRDQRGLVVENLVAATGGTASPAENGKLLFSLPGGPTLVTSEQAVPLGTVVDTNGFVRITGGNGADFTDDLRGGRLGSLVGLRDDDIAGRLEELDVLAADLITRSNAVTTASFDLDGIAGRPLFLTDPAPATGAARDIRVARIISRNPSKLAVSTTGVAGNGGGALQLSRLQEATSAALGGKSPTSFFTEALASLGGQIVQADVATEVSTELVGNLEARRDAISGVSLDEEAIELIRYQRSYEASARFIQVLNEVTEIAVNLG